LGVALQRAPVVSRQTLARTTKRYAVGRSCSVALKGLPGEMELAYLEVER
jgi:hypothetical protein